MSKPEKLGVCVCVCARVRSVAQSCLTLCGPMDCSLPGSSVSGVLQAGILEWIAMPFSRDLSDPGIEPTSLMSPALQAGSLPLAPPGKPPGGISGKAGE